MIATRDDPSWPRASAWLAGDTGTPLRRLSVLGAPVRLGSITPGRCDLAPAAIRAGLDKYSSYDVESDSDLRAVCVRDLGDLPLADAAPEEAIGPIADAVARALSGADAVALLGGDNSITMPGCQGMAPSLERCGLITFDAHFDLRDIEGGLSNGNPIRALLARGLPGPQICQIGIQSFVNSKAYRDVARAEGIHVVTADQTRARGMETVVAEALERLAERVEAIYLDVDLDVLDRAFAPGTPGSRPGGLMPWELRRAVRLCGLHPKVRAVDFVEVDPSRDVADATVLAAASALLSFASGLLARPAG